MDERSARARLSTRKRGFRVAGRHELRAIRGLDLKKLSSRDSFEVRTLDLFPKFDLFTVSTSRDFRASDLFAGPTSGKSQALTFLQVRPRGISRIGIFLRSGPQRPLERRASTMAGRLKNPATCRRWGVSRSGARYGLVSRRRADPLSSKPTASRIPSPRRPYRRTLHHSQSAIRDKSPSPSRMRSPRR